MKCEFEINYPGNGSESILLYDGIKLAYTDVVSDSFFHQHEALGHILQINYCKAGQMAWDMKHGSSIFLNPGDFSVHTLNVCTDSTFRFPTGQYRGLSISIDLREVSAHPPKVLAETGIFSSLLKEKLCGENRVAFLAGNVQSESIFSGFYDKPEKLRRPYQKIKVLELLLYLAHTEEFPSDRLAEYPSEQIAAVRKIHDQLLQHMEQRITIGELSRQYLINPTTLKAAFKAVYGTSLAAHIKQHRMEQAAKMLRGTDMSVAEIAAAVGYESQSRFSATFKNQFAMLPMTYRKHR